MLSENEEEYLEGIYSLLENNEKPSTSRIAEAMGVSRASVSEMVKKLGDKGFLKHQRYGEIELTEEGTTVARKIKRKHRLLESLLGFLGMREVHDEACKLEHGISEESADAICRFLGSPERCPDDNKNIPKCGRDCSECLSRTLAEILPDKEVTVVRMMCGRKASMRLNELGFVPGERIRVIKSISNGPIEVEVKGTKVAIGNGLARKVLVEECE